MFRVHMTLFGVWNLVARFLCYTTYCATLSSLESECLISVWSCMEDICDFQCLSIGMVPTARLEGHCVVICVV